MRAISGPAMSRASRMQSSLESTVASWTTEMIQPSSSAVEPARRTKSGSAPPRPGRGTAVTEPSFLEEEEKLVANMKKGVLAALGLAAQKLGNDIKNHQEVLSDAADMIMTTYAAESGLLRARKKAAAEGEDRAAAMADMFTLYTHDAIEKLSVWGKNILAMVTEGDELRVYLAALRRLTRHQPPNRAAARRQNFRCSRQACVPRSASTLIKT